MPPTFSANLGFLWTELDLPDAIHAAGQAGFDAVEFHEPYEYDPATIHEALDEAGVRAISLNTRKGDRLDDFGLAALPDRRHEARAAIDEAVDYARRIACEHVSVLSGIAARTAEGDATLVANLEHALDITATSGPTLLIEPINTVTVPGYYVSTIDHAVGILDLVSRPGVRLMIDCFHTWKTEGDVVDAVLPHLDRVGHIQIASIPDRAEPDTGELDYQRVFSAIDRHGGYDGAYGAEYHPRGRVEQGLAWLGAWTNGEVHA